MNIFCELNPNILMSKCAVHSVRNGAACGVWGGRVLHAGCGMIFANLRQSRKMLKNCNTRDAQAGEARDARPDDTESICRIGKFRMQKKLETIYHHHWNDCVF